MVDGATFRRDLKMSRLDHLYRSLLLTKFFTKGWGKPENLKRLFEFRKIISCRETCQHLVSADHSVHIDLDEMYKECRIIEGHFVSPFCKHLPGIMPPETETARFQMILPKVWPDSRKRPVCVHLAGTGDHYYWRRRTLLARPLLKEAGIASILLENPFYGVRKPHQQLRSSLHNVSDLFVMGGALVLESLVLFHWCERRGYGPLGITGISMGGHMASLAATNWHKPVSLVPILSWSTASSVFTEGVMSEAIPWKLLQDQYFSDNSYEDEIAKLVHSPEENARNVAFQLGRTFARNYPDCVSDIELLQQKLISTSSEKNPSHSVDSAAVRSVTNKNQVASMDSPGSAQYHTSVQLLDSQQNSNHSAYSERTRRYDWLHAFSRSNSLPCDSVLHFMRGVMDECTHLGNFSCPVDTSLVIVVAAKSDAYIPRDHVLSIEDLWPGAEVRFIETGHIAAYLFKQSVFRQAIIDAFKRQFCKYQ